MNGQPIKKEHSRLDPFFYFKRGYSQYVTYILGVIEFLSTSLTAIVLVFHVPTTEALILLVVSGPIAGFLTIRLGAWDMVRGGKKIDVRMHYRNDEIASAQIKALYVLLQKIDPAQAEEYIETMQRYGVFDK